MTWLGSEIKYLGERIKNRMGFSFRKWILEVSFLSFSFNLSHTLALLFLQMRECFLWDFQIEREPKRLNFLARFFSTDGRVAVSMPIIKCWPSNSIYCPLQIETRTGKFCPFCISWYMFDSFHNGRIFDRLWNILFVLVLFICRQRVPRKSGVTCAGSVG